jgi:hypothetical protein
MATNRMTDLHFFEPRQMFCIGLDQEIIEGMRLKFDIEKKTYIWEKQENTKIHWWHICNDAQVNIETFIKFCNQKKQFKDQQILIGWWEKFKQSNHYINEQTGTIQKHLHSLLQ